MDFKNYHNKCFNNLYFFKFIMVAICVLLIVNVLYFSFIFYGHSVESITSINDIIMYIITVLTIIFFLIFYLIITIISIITDYQIKRKNFSCFNQKIFNQIFLYMTIVLFTTIFVLIIL